MEPKRKMESKKKFVIVGAVIFVVLGKWCNIIKLSSRKLNLYGLWFLF